MRKQKQKGKGKKEHLNKWDCLPEEVLTEIFLLVPFESLAVLRCVSRTWNTLITSPNFVFTHLNRTSHKEDNDSNHDLVLVSFEHTDEEWADEYSYVRLHDGVITSLDTPHSWFKGLQVVGYCNGVVCLIDGWSSHDCRDLLLWNPSIRKSLKLPRPSCNPDSYECLICGFGFDAGTNDFKVVRVVTMNQKHVNHRGKVEISDYGHKKAEIFSMNACSWKTIDMDCGNEFIDCVYMNFVQWKQFLFDGIVHWLVYSNAYNPDDCFVLSYDPTIDLFEDFTLPIELSSKGMENIFMFGFYDHFAVLHRGEHKCYMWVMMKYRDFDSWTQVFTFQLPSELSMLAVRKDGELLVKNTSRRLCCFDPRTRNIKDLGEVGYFDYIVAIPFIKSLVLLHVPNGTKPNEAIMKKREGKCFVAMEYIDPEDDLLETENAVADLVNPEEKVAPMDANSVLSSEWGGRRNFSTRSQDIDKQLVTLENSVQSVVTSIASLRSDIQSSSGQANGGIQACSKGATARISAAKARIADLSSDVEHLRSQLGK